MDVWRTCFPQVNTPPRYTASQSRVLWSRAVGIHCGTVDLGDKRPDSHHGARLLPDPAVALPCKQLHDQAVVDQQPAIHEPVKRRPTALVQIVPLDDAEPRRRCPELAVRLVMTLGAHKSEIELHGARASHLLPCQPGLVRHSSPPWLHTRAALDQPATTDMALTPLRRWIEPRDCQLDHRAAAYPRS
jgi:hypothetical protein